MPQELKSNPIATVLLAFLVGAMGFIGLTMNTSFNQLWQKLDRVTTLMLEKENSLRSDMRDIIKMQLCSDRDIAALKERLDSQIRLHDREINKQSNGNNKGGN